MAEPESIRFKTRIDIDYLNIVGMHTSPRSLCELLMDGNGKSREFAVIADEALPGEHLRFLLSELPEKVRKDVTIVRIAAGEHAKTLGTYKQIIDLLVSSKVHRRSVLVAFGGGVILDVVGFVAATFMRGLSYISVPTSVMAQLDASVGGKVAVNHKSAKNLVGAFWHPDGVIIDPHYLSTLPDAEIRNGLAEAVKVAIIDSPELFELLERLTGHSSGPDLSPEALTPIIRLAVEAKIRLLADDPFERDLRRALNLGHTFAHAFETQQNYTLRHGYAVAIGTAIATMVSVLRGRLDTNTANRIFNTLESLDLPTSADREIAEEIWNKTLLIKRIRGNNIHYVIPIEIGQVDIVDELTKDEFLVAYMAILERRRSMSMGVGISSGASR